MWKKLLCVGQQPSPPSTPTPTRQQPTTPTSTATRSVQPTLPQLAVQQPISTQSITHPTTPTATTTSESPTTRSDRPNLPPLIAPTVVTPVAHLTPPTPIDPPSSACTPTATSLPFSPSSTSTLSPSSHLTFPSTTSQHPNPHPSTSQHHRRTSSTGSNSGSRAYRETLNAYAVDSGDGTRSVNQYRLEGGGESHLGKGSYATVERATDRESGVEYAIKEFSKRRLRQIAATEAARRSRSRSSSSRGGGGGRGRPRPAPRRPMQIEDEDGQEEEDKDKDQGPDNLQLIKTEVAIMKKVEHPNIARVQEVIDVTSDDALLIVLELCAGGPILRITQGEQVEPMEEDRARDVCRQLVLGIAYLHHNNIVHRDIKPDNCLFLADLKHVKLIDFGISKFTEKDDEGMDSKGSPAYMAPELLGGAGASGGGGAGGEEGGRVQQRLDMHGYACDVWSLGVTLYALVVGRLPFDDPDPSVLFKSIREADPSIPTTLSPSLQSLLRSLLTKSPSSRPTIHSLWTDAWLTQDGANPFIPYEENCIAFPEPTQAEVDRALNALRASTFLAMSVVAKLKGMRRRSSSIDPGRERGERERSGTGMTSLSSDATESEGGKTPLGGGQVVASPMSSPFLGATDYTTSPPPAPSSSHAPPSSSSSSPTPTPPSQPQRQPTLSLSPLDAVADQDGGPSVPSPLNGPSSQQDEKGEQDQPRIQRVEEPLMMEEPEEM